MNFGFLSKGCLKVQHPDPPEPDSVVSSGGFQFAHQFSVNSVVCNFIFIALFIALPSYGKPGSFQFPVRLEKSSVTFEHSIDEDLMKLYHQELKEIKAGLPTALPKEEKRYQQQKLLSERNQKTIESFKKNSQMATAGAGKTESLTQEQAQRILDRVKDHPVVSMDRIPHYDPNLEVGFCFGRAAYLHLELLRHGIQPDSLAKIFVIGPLTALKTEWDFHMAVLVKGPNNQWWALDNFANKVLSMEDWILETTKLAQNPKTPSLRIYLSDALKFQPGLGMYSEKNMSFAYFNRYFVDLMKWFQSHPVVPKDSFQSQPGT